MNTEKYFDRIEQYFAGEMNAAEERAFEAEMETNSELKETVEGYHLADEALELLIGDNLRNELQEWGQEAAGAKVVSIQKEQKREAKVISLRSYASRFAMAASVLLLIGFFTFQFMGSQYSNESLRTAYYENPDFSQLGIRGDDEFSLDDAYTALKANDLDKGMSLLQEIPADNNFYAEAQYRLGEVYLVKKEYKNAIKAFDNVVTTGHTSFVEDAEWNKIVAYLGTDNLNDDFHITLDNIVNDDGHAHYKKAKKLKEELGSFWR